MKHCWDCDKVSSTCRSCIADKISEEEKNIETILRETEIKTEAEQIWWLSMTPITTEF